MAPASTSSHSWTYSSTDRSTVSRLSPFSDEGSLSTHTSGDSAAGQQTTPTTTNNTSNNGASAATDVPTNHARPRGSDRGRVSKSRGNSRGSQQKKGGLVFITTTNPEQSRDPEILREVRRQAMNHSLQQNNNKLFHRRQKRESDSSATQAKAQRGGYGPARPSTFPLPYRRQAQEQRRIGPELPPVDTSIEVIPRTQYDEEVQRQDLMTSWVNRVIQDPTEGFFAAAPRADSPQALVTPEYWPMAIGPGFNSPSTEDSEPELFFPFSPYGYGHDPFSSLPKPQNPSINVIKLKHNCVTFFSSEGLRKMWASRALDDRLFFFSALCIASRHEDALKMVPDSELTLALETEVISMLNQTVLDPELQASDDTICSVMHLATAQNYRQEDTSFQWYDFMLSLVEKRGGFHGLTTFPALPWILTMNSLGSAVIRECPPPEPFFAAATLQIYAARENPFILESPVCSPETGFAVIPYSQHGSEQTTELLEMVRRLVDTVTIDDPRSARDHYNSQRDLIHMQLLAFKSADVAGHEASGNYIYESCRLAAIILEKAVYHSTSLSGAVAKTNLTSQLKLALSKTPLESMWDEMAGVLLWIAFVAAGAAHHSAERQAFVGVGTRTAIKHSFTHADSVIRTVYKLCQVQSFCTAKGSPKKARIVASPDTI